MSLIIMPFDPLSILHLKFRGRTVAVLRDHCSQYDGIVAVAQRNFQFLQDVPADDIVLMARIPGYPVTDRAELSKEVWPTLSRVVHSVTMVLKSELQTSTSCSSPCSPSSPLPMPSSPPQTASGLSGVPPQQSGDVAKGSQKKKRKKKAKESGDVIQTIIVTFPSDTLLIHDNFEVSEAGLLGKKTSHLFQLIETEVGYPFSNSRLSFQGTYLDNDLTFADYNIASGDSILVSPSRRPVPLASLPAEMRLRKPIIYLHPPTSLPNITVELLLASSWHFSAVYPSPQITSPFSENQPAQSITWEVAAEHDGTLVNKSTGTEVSYLFWEAIAKSYLVTPEGSRATTPVEDIEAFDPSRPSVNPGDSVLLPIDKVTSYLDAALKALALHTEARTSFITYWLPDLLKHEYVALRFLPQASYEKAAQMRISPVPDVVTRVFMLFQGVAEDDLGLWSQAAARATAEDGATFWPQVVGVDAVRACDGGLFRVLEWGGMEIK